MLQDLKDGVGEATVCDTIRWVEDTLIKDGTFSLSLPGKKALLEDNSIEVVLVDVTEFSIERPQKTANRRISHERIFVENINAKIKAFKIMKYPYRNRRKRHGLRLNLICGIINFEVSN